MLTAYYIAQPVFLSIKCTSAVIVDGERPCVVPSLAAFFPNGRGAHILHYGANMTILWKPYHIFYCTPSFMQQTNPNSAMVTLVSSTPLFNGTPWPGTVVVLKFADETCTHYEDIDEDDVHHIRIHFAMFGRYRLL